MANWFGYDSIVMAQQPAVPSGAAKYLNIGEQEADLGNEQAEADIIQEDTKPGDIEEQKHVLFYFRCDEGPGNSSSFNKFIEDISDHKYKCEFDNARESPWSQDKLEKQQPLDYEDKWGQENQPSYSIDLSLI